MLYNNDQPKDSRLAGQSNLLESIEHRLHSRQSLHYVQDDYDGAQPMSGLRSVVLDESDVQLMWALFDYPATFVTDNDPNEDTSTSIGPSAIPNTSAEDHLVTQDAVEDVNWTASASKSQPEFPEPFVNDWSLFGVPWTSYYPSEPLRDVWSN